MKLTLAGALLGVALGACYPDSISDGDAAVFDAVTTIFDQSADFGSVVTFAVPDSVVHFIAEGEEDDISREFDNEILAQIRQNMTALGYAEVADPALTPPDVVVQVGATTTTNYGYIFYDWWSYWGWYYPWYPGYGPGWGTVYPPSAAVYDYETGTLLMVMIDRRRQDPAAETIPVVWAGALTGLLGDTDASLAGRITSGINQAFAQSPYLGTP